ncbi:hypothetical protein B5F77_00760 [Parabacteroides sp. An277]|uniref:M43 family zinc metalloprotease n=1 Tax=Parabacteroides sp. An277 TaxID=1965619 RepID=UPI000B3A132C|nr:M43 family zinc metalloprotease [Parabacteroides sp. An277]OUO55770.1 hypothetical protein B5F77_00760 [Parabacteroides sp. An277]
MNIFGKKIKDYLEECDFLSHGYKLLAAVLLAFGMAACGDDDPVEPEPEPEPASTFKLHIGEGNVVRWEDFPDYYPPQYTAYLVMEDLPADEKILYQGGCYSIGDTVPDISDCTLIYDLSDNDTFQNWDWEAEPLIWECINFLHPLPGTTYYLRGYVRTDKGEYYSNTVAVRSSFTEPLAENPDAYEIPVVFHLFPDAEGNYPVKDWMIEEQLDYANHVYGNYYNLPEQTETGVRFVAATHTPDGTPLETPGIVHEKEAVEVDFLNLQIDDQYIWDMEYALNVWVCPILNAYVDEYTPVVGFVTDFPYFDADELLEGCATYKPGIETGIFLNSNVIPQANYVQTFAHEAGHFLGLRHVFEEQGDYCADTRWYDRDAYVEYTDGGNTIDFGRTDGETGEFFWSDNVMDYDYSFLTGFTPDQVERIQYTLEHAYFIPGEAGKEESPALRSARQTRRFGNKPVR